MGEFSVWHWLIVAVVVLVLFGSKRLPDAARSIGRSLRIFKSEMRDFRDEPADAARATPAIDSDLRADPDGSGGAAPTARPAEDPSDRSGGAG